jgi:hypothetical protein
MNNKNSNFKIKEFREDEVTRMLVESREMAEWDRVASLRNARNEGIKEKA